ncbi:MAG: hypothetical protein HYT72_04460 [Candidatus Aenigmarchaeota archaeon]|nr:hypothetical protein [Candidatus Aenigmarchaeota archaeon]
MIPAEHFRNVKRTWYKVKWVKSPPGQSLEGRIDIVREEDLPEIKEFVKILDEVRAEKCAAGIRLGYGKTTEEEIDRWMDKNKR